MDIQPAKKSSQWISTYIQPPKSSKIHLAKRNDLNKTAAKKSNQSQDAGKASKSVHPP
eukprot:UN10986